MLKRKYVYCTIIYENARARPEMLLACALAQARYIIRDAADFGGIGSNDAVFVGQNIRFAYFQQATLRNVQIDCLSHVIAAETPPFEIVANVTIRNCVFDLTDGLSADFNDSALINSTIVSTRSQPVFQRVSGSVLTGVRSSTAFSLAVNVTNATVVGCAFQHAYKDNNTVPALFGNASSSVFQNCHFNLSIDTTTRQHVAGLAIQLSACEFSRVRAVAHITARLTELSMYAGGFFAQLNGPAVKLSDSDFLVHMRVSYAFSFLGSVMAHSNANSTTINNISVTAKMNIGTVDSQYIRTAANYIGGFASDLGSGATHIQYLSIFVDIAYNRQVNDFQVKIAGLFTRSIWPSVVLTECHVFGTIAIRNMTGGAQEVAGLSTDTLRDAQLNACSFSGKIICDIRKETSTFIAGLGIGFQHVTLQNCVVNCDIGVNISDTGLLQISGLIGKQATGKVVSSVANSVIRVNSTSSRTSSTIGGLLAGTIASVTVNNSYCEVLIQLVQVSGSAQIKGIALLFADAVGNATNCSARGDIVVKAENISSPHSQIAAIAVVASQFKVFAGIEVVGSINVPVALRPASGFGAIGNHATISNVLIAVALPEQIDINAFHQNQVFATVSGLLIDCGLNGNNVTQRGCSNDLKSKAAADALGGVFGWKMEYNDGYPYLVNLPTWNGAKYVLPTSGPFSAEFYYVDGLGYPFPKTDYQICRGACYGVYESPLVRNCTNTTNNNSYCIQPELAKTDFQTASCIQENAHCNSGASICTSESELKLSQTDSTYSCELGCPRCVNGYCQNSTCVCNLYHSGDDCSTYQCDNDSPACFGDPTMQCAADGSGCVPTDAYEALGFGGANLKAECGQVAAVATEVDN